VSPVLFILSVSALFQWLEDRHSILQAISFVDDIGLVIECDELEEGTTRLAHIARGTMQWGSDNKVQFEECCCSHRQAIVCDQAGSNKVARLLAGLEAKLQDTL
jgi:hypothetical protein